MTTTWYASTAGDVVVDDQNRTDAGLTLDLFTDTAFTTRATGLVNEAGDAISGTPTAGAAGRIRFGDPAGGTRTYYSPGRYSTVAGVATPDPTGGFFEWRPDPQALFVRFVNGAAVAPDGTPIAGPGGADSRLKSDTGTKARAAVGVEDEDGNRQDLAAMQSDGGKWVGFGDEDPDTGRVGYHVARRRGDGTMFPFKLNKVLVEDVVEVGGDSIAGRFLSTGTDIGVVTGAAGVATTGQGGQRWDSVVGRGGGEPVGVTVVGGVIPASGSVACSINVELRPDTVAVSGVLMDVQVRYVATETTVTPDPTDPGGGTSSFLTGTLTRVTPGVPVIVPPGSPLKRNPTLTVSTGPALLRAVPLRDGAAIWLPGRHDQQRNPGIVIELLEKQLAQLTSEGRRKTIIATCLPWCAGAQAQPIGSALREQLDWFNYLVVDRFPRNAVDINPWLQSADTIQAVTGAAATTQDLADIALGLTPTTFRIQGDGVTVDAGHPGVLYGVPALIQRFGMFYTANGFGQIPWTY